MQVEVRLGCSCPHRLDLDEALKAVPFGAAYLEVVPGGLTVRGLLRKPGLL